MIQSHTSGPVEGVDCPCTSPDWCLLLRQMLGDAAGKSSHMHITCQFPMLHPLGAGVIFQPACLDIAESCGLERNSNQQLKKYLGLAYGPGLGLEAKAGRKRGARIKVSR